MKTEAKLLAIVSFAVLMENGDGIIGKAPSYVLEKFNFAQSCYYIFGALDNYNRERVITWGKKWGVDFEKIVEEMNKDYFDIPRDQFKEKYFMEAK